MGPSFDRFQKLAQRATNVKSEAEKPLVMVIDDDLSIRNALKFSLKDKYRIVLCVDGEDGISSVTEEVSVIVLDIKMPGKDGFQVYEEIKLKYEDVPIIFYSAFQNIRESISFKRQYQPFGYFDKSGDTKELLMRIDQAVDRHSLTNRLKQEALRKNPIS